MKQNQTELAFILDRSGSMCGLEADTIGDHNASLLHTSGRWMEKPDRAGFPEQESRKVNNYNEKHSLKLGTVLLCSNINAIC